ncbi:MAG: hypothetical protein HXO23_04065 [Prevotella sp.]|nr:hypothetical protein [Prevotella sp.]
MPIDLQEKFARATFPCKVLVLAEAPQAPKSLFYHLRKLRKHQKVCFIICGSSASTKIFVLLFAEAPQALKSLFCYLRKLRKRQKVCFVICGSSASTKKFVLLFAKTPQASIVICFETCGAKAPA